MPDTPPPAAVGPADAPPVHEYVLRVYYEDTDLAGIVYYANYLRFIERARTELLREQGIDQGALRADQDVVFAVRRVAAEYLLPARFDDLLTVQTRVLRVGGARVDLDQRVLRARDLLFTAEVQIVCLAGNGAPRRIPAEIRRKLGRLAP